MPGAQQSPAGEPGPPKSSSLPFSFGTREAADFGEREPELIRPDAELPGLNVAGACGVEPAGDLGVDGFEFLQKVGSDLPGGLPFEFGLAGETQPAVEVGLEEREQRGGAGVFGALRVVVGGREQLTIISIIENALAEKLPLSNPIGMPYGHQFW